MGKNRIFFLNHLVLPFYTKQKSIYVSEPHNKKSPPSKDTVPLTVKKIINREFVKTISNLFCHSLTLKNRCPNRSLSAILVYHDTADDNAILPCQTCGLI